MTIIILRNESFRNITVINIEIDKIVMSYLIVLLILGIERVFNFRIHTFPLQIRYCIILHCIVASFSYYSLISYYCCLSYNYFLIILSFVVIVAPHTIIFLLFSHLLLLLSLIHLFSHYSLDCNMNIYIQNSINTEVTEL